MCAYDGAPWNYDSRYSLQLLRYSLGRQQPLPGYYFGR